MAGFTGAHKGREPVPTVDHDVHSRIADMDFEGVDVNLLLPSGWFGAFTTVDDLSLEAGRVPRLQPLDGRLLRRVSGSPRRRHHPLRSRHRRRPARSSSAARASPGPWGIFVYAPYGKPLDHPDFEPYWAAAQEHDLSVVLHTFTVMPPYAPGGLDTWDNLWLQRSAAHPWCGMRNMASVIGSGAMDRYPNLRVGCLEAGHSWLPFWVKRLDEHAESIASALPPLQHTPSEYVQSGRYFQSIEMSEGAALTQMVARAARRRHSDVRVGLSARRVVVPQVRRDGHGLGSPAELKQKLFWDNPLQVLSTLRGRAASAALPSRRKARVPFKEATARLRGLLRRTDRVLTVMHTPERRPGAGHAGGRRRSRLRRHRRRGRRVHRAWRTWASPAFRSA